METTTLNNNTMENLNLTELETKVLTALIDNLYAEPGFSDVDANDLSRYTKIPMKVIRGVIASLVKKDILNLDDNGEYVIIYLNMGFWYLHPSPTWKEEADMWFERFSK